MVPAEMYPPHLRQQTLLLSDTTTTRTHFPLPLPPRLFFLPNLTTMVPSMDPFDRLRLLVLQSQIPTRRTEMRMKLKNLGGVGAGNEEGAGRMIPPFLLLLETEEIKETNLLLGLVLLDLTRVLVRKRVLLVAVMSVLLARPPQLWLQEATVKLRFLVTPRRRRRKLLHTGLQIVGSLLLRLPRTARRDFTEGTVDPSVQQRATETGADAL